MALSSKLTKQLEHPDEPGATFTIRKLSHHMVMMATDAKRDAALDLMKRLDGVTLPTPALGDTVQEPAQTYDRSVVLLHGITAWSYDEPLSATAIDDLDEETAAWLFAEIIAFSLKTPDEVKPSANGSLNASQAATVGQVN
jgi:hypothetical protein